MTTTAAQQNPLAVVLSCIDSRVPAELVFDLGLGDIFSVRVAGNVVGTKSLASVEFGVAATGLKLVLVLGHTRCGAVTTSVDLLSRHQDVVEATGSTHLPAIVNEIEHCCSKQDLERFPSLEGKDRESVVDAVAKRNVERTVKAILNRSELIRNAVESGQVLLVGALYDVQSGNIEFFTEAK
jgi:carbonic anhydrase/SulP family sulfate permease